MVFPIRSHDGVVHASPAPVHFTGPGRLANTFCGRTISLCYLYNPARWPDMVSEVEGLRPDEETDICRECVREATS